MKNIITGFVLFAILGAACNTSGNKPIESKSQNNDTLKATSQVKTENTPQKSPIREIVIGYLRLKNALVNDDGPDAANSGKIILDEIRKLESSPLTTQQKKAIGEVADDIKENAEYCSKNGDNIDQQREHFEMLSQEVYHLVKAIGTGQTLYYDHCPIYNHNKGANWISETKEIKNPYLGRKMPRCGSVKEELK